MERVVKPWTRLPRAVVGFPSLEVFEKCMDVHSVVGLVAKVVIGQTWRGFPIYMNL